MTGDQPVFVNHVLDVPLHFLLVECFHFRFPFAFTSFIPPTYRRRLPAGMKRRGRGFYTERVFEGHPEAPEAR